MKETFNKYAECIDCKRIFTCTIKKDKPDKCLHFEKYERGKDKK